MSDMSTGSLAISTTRSRRMTNLATVGRVFAQVREGMASTRGELLPSIKTSCTATDFAN